MPAGDAGPAFLQTLDSRPSARFSDECSCARQNDFKFGELTGLRIDVDRPAMLLDNDVVTDDDPEYALHEITRLGDFRPLGTA